MDPLPMAMLPGDLWVGGQCRGSEGELCGGCGHQQDVSNPESQRAWRIQKSLEGCGVIITDGACWDLQVGRWNDQGANTWGTGEKGTGPRFGGNKSRLRNPVCTWPPQKQQPADQLLTPRGLRALGVALIPGHIKRGNSTQSRGGGSPHLRGWVGEPAIATPETLYPAAHSAHSLSLLMGMQA